MSFKLFFPVLLDQVLSLWYSEKFPAQQYWTYHKYSHDGVLPCLSCRTVCVECAEGLLAVQRVELVVAGRLSILVLSIFEVLWCLLRWACLLWKSLASEVLCSWSMWPRNSSWVCSCPAVQRFLGGVSLVNIIRAWLLSTTLGTSRRPSHWGPSPSFIFYLCGSVFLVHDVGHLWMTQTDDWLSHSPHVELEAVEFATHGLDELVHYICWSWLSDDVRTEAVVGWLVDIFLP